MSAIPVQDDDNPYFVDAFDADDPNGRVYVNGTELPTTSKQLHIRNEGPLDYTRYLECGFASPRHGERYTRLFDTLTPYDQTEYDTVRVQVKNPLTEDYDTVFYGYVTGVGNKDDAIPKHWKFRAQGIGHLLTKLPASRGFNETATAADVLNYITERLDDELSIPVTNTIDDTANETVTQEYEHGIIQVPFSDIEIDTGLDVPLGFNGIETQLGPDKQFQYGTHTLADVVRWLGQQTNTYMWFEPTNAGAVFAVARDPATQRHKATHIGGSLAIERNNALAELKPVNTVVVKSPVEGSTGRSKKIAVVRARHQGLYERAGNTELVADPHKLSEAHTKAALENEARKRLKSTLAETTAGEMTAVIDPTVTPFDTIEALPTADGNAADDLEPLTYEVSRVQHDIDTGPYPRMKLHVGVHTDPSEDIQIVDSYETARGQ